MESVQQESHQFLRVLLLVTTELLGEATDRDLTENKHHSNLMEFQEEQVVNNVWVGHLETARHRVRMRSRPDISYELCVALRNLAVHAKRVVDIEFVSPTVLQEVVGQRWHVAHTLQTSMTSCSHRRCVPDVRHKLEC